MSGGETPARSDADPAEGVTVPVVAGTAQPEARGGGHLGRYVPVGLAGQGGMGEVLRAYDPKLQREVALKRLRADATDPQAKARIVREARAMAKLAHPNVVTLYDVEEDPTRDAPGLFLAMEYVDGPTLEEWVAQRDHDWREVVAMFGAAGRGLAAAHAQGLLHRDFKPSNVLVSPTGVPKVTDFGLAQAANGSTAASSSSSSSALGSSGDPTAELRTETGMVLGTPRYMAPEQHRGEGLGPAADQFAFCVALWEALTGEAPYRDRDLVRRKHEGPPPWPQVSVPPRVVRALERGMAPAAEDRWPSMHALLVELGASARPRHRWVAAVAAFGMVGAVVGVASAWSGDDARCAGAEAQLAGIWDDARRAEIRGAILGTEVPFAAPVWAGIEPELDRFAAQWVEQHTQACTATTIDGVQSIETMDLRMGCLRRARLELAALSDVLATADADTVENATDTVADLFRLSRCSDLEGLRADMEPPTPEDAATVERIRASLAVAKMHRVAGRYDEAKAAVEQAEARATGVRYEPVRAEAAQERGLVLQGTGDYEASESALREALRLATGLHQVTLTRELAIDLLYLVGSLRARPEEALPYRALAESLVRGDPLAEAAVHLTVATAEYARGDFAKAEAKARRALQIQERELGPNHVIVADACSNLANALVGRGAYAEAEVELRRAIELLQNALGEEHPKVAAVRANLANAIQSQGRLDEAIAEYRRALAVQDEVLGPGHPQSARSRNNIATALQARGSYAESEAEHRRVLALRVASLGEDHPDVAASHNNLANALDGQRKYAEAEVEYRIAVRLAEKAYGPGHPTVAFMRSNLAGVLGSLGQHERAEAERRRVLAVLVRAFGAEHPDVARAHFSLASALQWQERIAEAEAEYRRAVEIQEKTLAPDHPRLAASRYALAEILLDQGRADEALPWAELAWDRQQRADVPLERRGSSAFALAQALWATTRGTSARARELATGALQDFTEAGDAFEEERADVERWLAAREMR